MTSADTGNRQAPPRRLERAREGRMVAGVCEGLGRYFDVDPVIFRVGFAIAAVAGGAGILAYAIVFLVLPEEGGRALVELPGNTPAWLPWVLGAIVVLAVADGFDHGPFGFGWGVVALAGIAFLIWQHNQQRASVPPPPPPAPPAPPGGDAAGQEAASPADGTAPLPPFGGARPSPFAIPPVPPAPVAPRPPATLARVAWSLLLVAAGVALLVDLGGGVDVDPGVFLAGALLAVGALLMVSAWIGRGRGLVGLGIVLTLAATAVTVTDVPFRGGTGERFWTPTGVVAPQYRLGAGEAHLDLTQTEVGVVDTDVSVGAGSLHVLVPADARVAVRAHAGIGEVRVLGRRASGFDVGDDVVSPGSELGPRITLDLRVGVGEVEVVRGGAS